MLLAALVALLSGAAGAAGLAPAAAARLARLDSAGYAVLPAGTFMDRAAERDILADVRRLRAQRPDPAGPEGLHFDIVGPAHPGIQDFSQRLRESLERPAQGRLELIESLLRSYYDYGVSTQASEPHVDGGYLTVTYALAGPGTALYPVAGGRVSRVRARTRQPALLSAVKRELLVGTPAIVHSTPPGRFPERVVLLLRFSPRGTSASEDSPPFLTPELAALQRAREEEVRAFLKRRPRRVR